MPVLDQEWPNLTQPLEILHSLRSGTLLRELDWSVQLAVLRIARVTLVGYVA